jgi:hypothetical protein
MVNNFRIPAQLAQRVNVRTYFISHPTSNITQATRATSVFHQVPQSPSCKHGQCNSLRHTTSPIVFSHLQLQQASSRQEDYPSYLFILLSSLALSFSINSLTETSVPLASVPLFFSCLSLHILTIHYDGSPSPELLGLDPPLVGHNLSSRSSVSSRGCRCWR